MDLLSRAISHARVTARYNRISPAILSQISAGYGHIRSDGRVELALEMSSAIGIVTGALNSR